MFWLEQIPNLSFGLWMSRVEIISSDTTSDKKLFEKLRRSYFWLEDFVEFEAFVPPFCWVEARGLVNMVKFGIAIGIFLLRSVIISATEECDDSDLDVFFYIWGECEGMSHINHMTAWWWFQMLSFSPLLGEKIQFDTYFSDGLKPPARYPRIPSRP